MPMPPAVRALRVLAFVQAGILSLLAGWAAVATTVALLFTYLEASPTHGSGFPSFAGLVALIGFGSALLGSLGALALAVPAGRLPARRRGARTTIVMTEIVTVPLLFAPYVRTFVHLLPTTSVAALVYVVLAATVLGCLLLPDARRWFTAPGPAAASVGACANPAIRSRPNG